MKHPSTTFLALTTAASVALTGVALAPTAGAASPHPTVRSTSAGKAAVLTAKQMQAAAQSPSTFKIIGSVVQPLTKPLGPSSPMAPTDGGWFRQVTLVSAWPAASKFPAVNGAGFTSYPTVAAAQAGLDAIQAQYPEDSIVGATPSSKTFLKTYHSTDRKKTSLEAYSYVLTGTNMAQSVCFYTVSYPAKPAQIRKVVTCGMDVARAQAAKLG